MTGAIEFDGPTLQLSGEPVTPFVGESLRSLVVRSCFENGLPNSYGLLGPLGLPYRNQVRVAEGDSIRSDDLAYAIRLPEGEIIARRYEPLGQGYLDFFGVQISRLRINYWARRFAPAALSKGAYHRATWELRDLPFCLESWDRLHDICPCPLEGTPTIQRWIRTQSRVGECDGCGYSLRELPQQLVPEEYRDDLSLLNELISPALGDARDLSKFLPAAIAGTDRGRIFDCLRLMCDIAVGGVIDGLNDEFAEAILRWHAACRALRDWPNSMPGEWIRNDTKLAAYSYRRDLYLDLASEPSMTMVEFKRVTGKRATLNRHPNSACDSAQRSPKSVAAKAKKLERKRARARELKEQRDLALKRIGIRPAYEAAKLDPDTILQARDEGLLASYERKHGPRLVPAFDRDEVIAFGLAWNARIPSSKVGYDLGISNYGVEQLVALEEMEASGIRFRAEALHFTAKNISTFLDKLKDGSSDKPGPRSSLRDAMRQIDDRPKPWGPALAAMLAGRFSYRLPRGFKSDLSSIEILAVDVAAITALRFERPDDAGINFAPDMVQRDVCEMFNINQTKSKEIEFLPNSGTIPKRFECSVVKTKRSELVSRMELANRFSMGWREINSLLGGRGVRPVAGKFYDRDKSMRELKRALKLKNTEGSGALRRPR